MRNIPKPKQDMTLNKVNVAHDLTKKQKEELKGKIEEAQQKEQNDHLGARPQEENFEKQNHPKLLNHPH